MNGIFNTIELSFSKGACCELYHLGIQDRDRKEWRRSVRGKTSGAYAGAGTFQWTSAVKALSALFVRTVINATDSLVLPFIEGGRDSAAASLDYAISKEPMWLSEMFGVETNGESTAKRVFKRTNPNMKRAGPVVIGVNPHMLAPSNIAIVLDGKRIEGLEEMKKLLQSIELQCVSKKAILAESRGGRLVVNS